VALEKKQGENSSGHNSRMLAGASLIALLAQRCTGVLMSIAGRSSGFGVILGVRLPTARMAAVASVNALSPVTAAQPRRICTCFPILLHPHAEQAPAMNATQKYCAKTTSSFASTITSA